MEQLIHKKEQESNEISTRYEIDRYKENECII